MECGYGRAPSPANDPLAQLAAGGGAKPHAGRPQPYGPRSVCTTPRHPLPVSWWSVLWTLDHRASVGCVDALGTARDASRYGRRFRGLSFYCARTKALM